MSIQVTWILGDSSGVDIFQTQEEAVNFCQSLYDKKLKSQNFTMSKIYGPASNMSYNYGRREVKAAVKKLPRFKAMTETKLKVTINQLP